MDALQLSSKGGVIVTTQAAALPAGYRIITPSALPAASAAGGGRATLNFVQVLSSTPTAISATHAAQPQVRPATITAFRQQPQMIAPRTQIAIAPAPGSSSSTLRPLLSAPVGLVMQPGVGFILTGWTLAVVHDKYRSNATDARESKVSRVVRGWSLQAWKLEPTTSRLWVLCSND